mmetsp:Transcript_10300/g.15579  ORF Transcript_10300/g.15579 Transcript_10300/m.15579 type:complete len:109 (+) Transcript_10300:422-748(+)
MQTEPMLSTHNNEATTRQEEEPTTSPLAPPALNVSCNNNILPEPSMPNDNNTYWKLRQQILRCLQIMIRRIVIGIIIATPLKCHFNQLPPSLTLQQKRLQTIIRQIFS